MLVLIFEAVPDGRIVAGGDNDAAARFFRQDAVAYHRCRRGSGAEVDLDAVTGHHLGGRRRKVLGGKAGVVADNQSAPGKSGLLEIISYPLGAETHVFKGEVLGDDIAPAIGTELDWVVFFNLPYLLNLAFQSIYRQNNIVPGMDTPAVRWKRRQLVPRLVK